MQERMLRNQIRAAFGARIAFVIVVESRMLVLCAPK